MERVISYRDGDADEVGDDDGDGHVDAEGGDVWTDADGVVEADAIGNVHVGDDADDAAGKAAAAPGSDGIRSGRRRMPSKLML